MVVGVLHLPQHPALPVDFQGGAGLEARPCLEPAEVIHDLAAVEQISVVEKVAVEAGPMRHLPAVGDLARHVDQVDRAVARHRREQGVAGLRQRRIVGDQPGAAAADLLLVDGGQEPISPVLLDRYGVSRPTLALSRWRQSPAEARENHRNGARRHHPVRPVLVAAGRGALLVEWLSLALHPLPAPLLACPALSILLPAIHLRLLSSLLLSPGLLFPVLSVLRLLALPAGARPP